MSRPIKKIYDCATGETIERELDDIEFAQYKADQAELSKFENDRKAKLLAKSALLQKLGISEDEAKLLLS